MIDMLSSFLSLSFNLSNNLTGHPIRKEKRERKKNSIYITLILDLDRSCPNSSQQTRKKFYFQSKYIIIIIIRLLLLWSSNSRSNNKVASREGF